jgi:hypothetical protein
VGTRDKKKDTKNEKRDDAISRDLEMKEGQREREREREREVRVGPDLAQ